MKIPRNPFFYLSIVLFFAVAFEVYGLVNAQTAGTWTAPTVAPPGGNPAQPIDTSNVPQTKNGGLTVATSTYVYGVKMAPGGNLVFGQFNSAANSITPQAGISIQNGVLSYTNDMTTWQPLGSGSGSGTGPTNNIWQYVSGNSGDIYYTGGNVYVGSPTSIVYVRQSGTYPFQNSSHNLPCGTAADDPSQIDCPSTQYSTTAQIGAVAYDNFTEYSTDGGNTWSITPCSTTYNTKGSRQFTLINRAYAAGKSCLSQTVSYKYVAQQTSGGGSVLKADALTFNSLNGGIFNGTGVAQSGANVLYNCSADINGNSAWGDNNSTFTPSPGNQLDIGQGVTVMGRVLNGVVQVQSCRSGDCSGWQNWVTSYNFPNVPGNDQIVMAGWGIVTAPVANVIAGASKPNFWGSFSTFGMSGVVFDNRYFFAGRGSTSSGNLESLYRCQLGS